MSASETKSNTPGGAALSALPARSQKEHGPVGALFAGLGNWFYTLGFAAEYVTMHIWRIVRDAGAFTGQLLAWLFSRLGRWLAAAAKGIWRDMTAPITDFRKRRQQLDRAKERAQQRGGEEEGGQSLRRVGVKSTLQFVLQLGSYLLPLATAAVLVFVVYRVMGMNYALEVKYNGQHLGYVADQSVVDGAKGLLRERIVLAQNQELSDWQLTPSYTIASTGSFTTTQQLVNNILRTSTQEAGDITEAIGVHLGGDLYGVVKDSEAVEGYLEGILDEYRATSPEGAQVEFVNPITFDDPADEPVYFTSSVEDTEAFIRRLSGIKAEERTFRADGAMTLEEIAHENGLPLDKLLQRNPAIAGEAGVEVDADGVEQPVEEEPANATGKAPSTSEEEIAEGGAYIPQPGTDLLIEREQPVLQVQTIERRQSVEAIPYETEERENDELAKGAKRIVQEGQEGEQEVWDDYIYIDGELDKTERVDELTAVLREPVPQIIEVGTMEIASAPGGLAVSGSGYIFPVPASPYSSRGYGGGHRGYDINAAAGAPIYAVQGGTVTTAGWHYSYGNYVIIEHPGGITSLYAHCSALYVTAGQAVPAGGPIGAVGSTGDSTGNHLHLEMFVGGQRVDPKPFVGYPY